MIDYIILRCVDMLYAACLQPAPRGSRFRSGSTRLSGAAVAQRRRAPAAHRGAARSARRRRGSAPPCNSGADCRSQAPGGKVQEPVEI